MTCIYCNTYLMDEGPYGRLASHQDGKVLGRIYRCPNHKGFENDEAAEAYLAETSQTLQDVGAEELSEVCCHSSVHSVSGSFYTDSYDNLFNGYPC